LRPLHTRGAAAQPAAPRRDHRRRARGRRGVGRVGHADPHPRRPPRLPLDRFGRRGRRQVAVVVERPRTLVEKVWDAHVVRAAAGEPDLLYIDLHLVHEVTSPQAFEGLRLAGRGVRRPDLTVATEDHNVPTTLGPVTDPVSRTQLEALKANCDEFGIVHYARGTVGQGIVHVIGPELGLTQPGVTSVCGD